MSEFDELLNEVISEDSDTDPPAGMERRILTALSADSDFLQGKKKVWLEVAAAAILIGLAATMPHWRSSSALPVIVPVAVPAGHVLGDLASSTTPTVGDHELPVIQPNQHQRRVQVSVATASLRRALQRNVTGVAPLKIEFLAVQPIEIASLPSSESSEKGELR